MRYLIIILLLCSCSSKFVVNGQEINQKTKLIGTQERVLFFSSFIFGYAVVGPFFIKYK